MLLLAPIPSSRLQKMSRVSVIRSFYALRPRLCSPINTVIPFNFTCFDKGKLSRFSVMAVPSASSSSSIPGLSSISMNSRSSRKKARHEAPESVLKHKLDMCSKNNDLLEALRLYDDARANGIRLSLHHYNVLLYLCSSPSSAVEESEDCSSSVESDENELKLGLERGFEIFKQMDIDKISPNEATFTNLARLALAKDDPEMAFELVKKMNTCGILPRLRSYGPALFGFSKRGDANRAYEVDSHMEECGVIPEEPELSALLKVSMDVKRDDKVYELLHRLRADVRQVTENTAKIIEEWFVSEAGSEIGMKNHDIGKVQEALTKGGGGWHGQGWLGSGKWRVVRTELNKTGVCRSCGEKLVSIDIDPKETENFATSLANLACQREVKAEFVRFQEWLDKHGPFDAVIDGANVGLVNTRTFNFFQLNNIVNQLREISPSKKAPLVILHKARVFGGPAQQPRNKKLLDTWRMSGTLYATPPGSNDDWYWLYAAVSNKCLLLTNDEMRDHLFQLLGNSFFPRWKEKHQVRLTVSRNGIELCMPPPYSIVIQESEEGSWHIPTVTGDDLETPRQWLCATRAKKRRTVIRSSKPKSSLSNLSPGSQLKNDVEEGVI
ncbi:hypothetical protein V2J09_001732 [Rumex salicifolius]